MKSIQEMLKSKYVGLFSTLVLALFTRLLGISSRPIWYDEAFSILFSEKVSANSFSLAVRFSTSTLRLRA